MSSAPPPRFGHPGSPPPRPEVPEGVTPQWSPVPYAETAGGPPPGAPGRPDEGAGAGEWPPPFHWWAPFAALVSAYALAVVVAILLGIAVTAAGGEVDGEELPTGIVLGATIAQDALMIALAIAFARVGGLRVTPATFGLRPVHPGRGLLRALAVFGAFYLFTVVWSLALSVDESDDLAQELGASDSALNLVAVAFLVGIAAPIAEELFFRGFMFPALWRRMGWVAAAAATGLIFGIVHAGGTDAVFLVPLAVLGGLLCLLYKWTGSLLPGMALHAFNNALALGVTLGWEWWQVVIAIVAAPALVVWIASAVAVRFGRLDPAPA